jgi:hypothetical protein
MEEVKRLRKKRYVKDIILPKVKHVINENKYAHKSSHIIISDILTRKYFPVVVNMNQFEIESIPPLYRLRLELTDQHIGKQEYIGSHAKIDFSNVKLELNSQTTETLQFEPLIDPMENIVDMVNNMGNYGNNGGNKNMSIEDQMFQKAINESINNDDHLQSAILESLGIGEVDNTSTNNILDNDFDNMLNIELGNILDDESGNSLDGICDNLGNDLDEFLEVAIMESSDTVDNIVSNVDNIHKSQSFYVMIDLRIYGPNQKQPIYVGDNQYYLTEFQRKLVENKWINVNYDTEFGKKTLDDLNYIYNMSIDLLTIN